MWGLLPIAGGLLAGWVMWKTWRRIPLEPNEGAEFGEYRYVAVYENGWGKKYYATYRLGTFSRKWEQVKYMGANDDWMTWKQILKAHGKHQGWIDRSIARDKKQAESGLRFVERWSDRDEILGINAGDSEHSGV